MGVKKQDATGEAPEAVTQPEEEPEKPEDPPLVKELKVLDDKYLELEREYEREVHILERRYNERQKPLLDERTQLLTAGDGPVTGTPALGGFWATALKNHPDVEDIIEDWDEPVLQYIRDITTEYLDENPINGFKLVFHFVENPYLTNTTLWKEYHTEEESPYTGGTEVKTVKVSEVEWKDGRNVTVEKVATKVKGGGAKKQKQKGKEKVEPRDSFFRHFFRNLEQGMSVPDDVNLDLDDEGDEDESEIIEMLMQHDHEVGQAIKGQIIPYAVRWYTGEASPDDDDDDEDDEDDDDDDDDDEEDESDEESEEEEKPKRGKAKGKAKKPAGAGEKKEECKQQ